MPSVFVAWAGDKPEWADVVGFLWKPEPPEEASEVSVLPEARGQPWEAFLPPAVQDLERLGREDRSGRQYEQMVVLAFQLLGFQTQAWGQNTGRNPDGLAWYPELGLGLILSAKAAAAGYVLDVDEQRKIPEYVRGHRGELEKRGAVRLSYVIVSSKFQRVAKIEVLERIERETRVKVPFVVSSDLLTLVASQQGAIPIGPSPHSSARQGS